MITLLIGKKGSEKTKKLIDHANEAVKNSNGNVVVIEKGLKLTYDISHSARLIDVDAYGIQGRDALFGFLSGICAGNYDVTDMFLDSTLKIIGSDMDALEKFVLQADELMKKEDVNLTISVSASEEEIPESVLKITSKI